MTPTFSDDDHRWMSHALALARAAAEAGEVPVGAVLVGADGQCLGEGSNAPIARRDPTAHAEIVALRAGCSATDNYRLPGATMFVTLEPCAMCMGAMLHARLERVVYATRDPKTGVCGSVLDLPAVGELNHQTRVEGGLLGDESATLLREFFRGRRAEIRAARQESAMQ